MASGLDRPIGRDEHAPGDPGLGMGVHERDKRVEGVFLDDGVGVQEQDVLRWVGRLEGRADHGVVAPGEPPVGVDGREVHPRIPAVLGDGSPEALFGIAAGPVLADRDPNARAPGRSRR